MLRTTIILTVAFFISSISAIAQSRMSVEDRVQHLKENLSLTDKQVDQVKTILVEADSIMTSMRSVMEKTDDKILSVLNDDQKTLYKKIIEERRSRMQGSRQKSD
jgi:uncharacterized protein YbaP (TraB family)